MLRIGVAGHRSLTDLDKLHAGILKALDRTTRTFRGQSFTIISSLADGADRIVVQTCLRKYPDSTLEVILPSPVEEYQKTFQSEASKQEFLDLLSRARVSLELSESSFEQTYSLAGKKILDSCDVLIAVWDGKEARGSGGTGEIVSNARAQQLPIVWIHAGNQDPETKQPTSLGEDQGKVTVENFDVHFQIRIGVTGDPDIPDDDQLKVTISEIIGTRSDPIGPKIRELYNEHSKKFIDRATNKKTAKVVYSVLTTLSKGAERFLARQILELPFSTIRAILPFQENVLASCDEESRTEFEDLLSRARHPRVLSKDPLTQPMTPGVRSAGYFEARRNIVDQCDVLIVLWNPDAADNNEIRQTIDYARNIKKRPVITVSTVAPYNMEIDPQSRLDADSITRLEVFNRIKIPEGEHRKQIKENFGEFLQNGALPVSEMASSIIFEELFPFFARASNLANRHKALFQWAGFLAYVFSVGAVGCVAIGTLFPDLSYRAFLAEFVVLALILIIILFANAIRSNKKWIENRFLAERIRSAIFLVVSGVDPSPIYLPPYMGFAHRPDDWMIMAFNQIRSTLPVLKGCVEQTMYSVASFVRVVWIQKQIAYHRNNARKAEHASRYIEWAGFALFGSAMIAAMLHVLLHPGASEEDLWSGALTLAAILMPALAASLEGIRKHREYSRMAKMSENLKDALTELDAEFQKPQTVSELEASLRKMEELTMRDNQSWLMIQRFLKLEPVV